MSKDVKRVGLVLTCEGMGDCLFAMAVVRKMSRSPLYRFDIFTHHPELFRACPYVAEARPIHDPAAAPYPHPVVRMFELDKLPYPDMDTFDFISIPLKLGELSFREKQIEFFPAEPDDARVYDVVLNTSMTWPTRSWPLENWQRLAEAAMRRGCTVAVIGKDVESQADKMVKRSPPLEGVANLTNALSLDQTYYTLRKCGLFVTGQNGLSVLAGATDVEMVVLGTSVEWSKRAIYRNEDPNHKVTYVRGRCQIYCAAAERCPEPEHRGELRCVPGYDAVEAAVLAKLPATFT